jgi:hypothetical protein
MKTLLICPSSRPGVPQLTQFAPLAVLPVFGECFAGHWVEHLALLGAREVRVIAADRAEEVRAALGDGARWGVRLDVVSVRAEPTRAEAAAAYRPAGEPGWLPEPHDLVLLDHLPGCRQLPLFESYASWFAALLGWVPRALTPARVRVHELRPGIWVSRRAQIASTAEMTAPCWIGDQAIVAAGAVVGPDAILEDRCVVDAEARVAHSWIGPDTYVGAMTSVESSLAWGSCLTNWLNDSSLQVPDPFLLHSLAAPSAPAALQPAARSAGAPARVTGSPLNWIAGWPAQADRGTNSNPPA